MRKKIFILLTILWMAVIFAFSARNAVRSSQDSSRIGMFIGQVFIEGFQEKEITEQMSFAGKIDYPVRKTAHAMEYAVLGMLLVGGVYRAGECRRKAVLLSWGIGTAYAATDELHQLFVPGRSGQLSDVLLDSTGVMAGVMFALLLIKAIRKCFKL